MNWKSTWCKIWGFLRLALLINEKQVYGVARTVLALCTGFAMGHGVSSGTVTFVAGLVGSIAPLVWTLMVHTQQASIATVAAMPEVQKIVTTKAISDAALSDKVTNGFVAPPKS